MSLDDSRPSQIHPAVSHLTSISCLMFSVGSLLVLFLAAGSLTWPMSDDHLHYAFVGDTIMQGGVPYRDAWDLKGPLTYYLYGVVRQVFGRNEVSIRIFDLLVVFTFCLQLRRLVLRLNGQHELSAMFASLCFLICYFGGGYYWTAQPDDWGGMLILVAVSLLLKRTPHVYLNAAAVGVVIAFAALVKPTFIIFAPLMLLRGDRSNVLLSDNLRRSAVGAVVLALVITTVYLWVFRHGGFHDLIDAMRFVNAAYSGRFTAERLIYGFRVLRELGLSIPYLLVPPGLVVIYRSGQVAQARLLSAWFALSIAMLVYQGVYYPYEYISATIAAIVIISSSLTHVTRRINSTVVRYVADGAIFVILSALCLAPLISETIFGAFSWPGYVFGTPNDSDYPARISVTWDRRYTVERLSSYLATHTNPGDKIQVWGWVSGLGALTLSNRSSATRFGDTWAVMTKTPIQSHYRRVFMEEISRSPPRCILVDLTSWSEPVSGFPEFNQFVHRHYALTGHIGDFQLWMRLPSTDQ